MDLFGIQKRHDQRTREVAIQAMDLIKREIQAGGAPEGSHSLLELESMLTGYSINDSIRGLNNAYKTYDSQVNEIYKKYNGKADWGNVQLRTLIDMRTAFIAGQGISISCNDPSTAKWIEKYITKNKLNGINFLRAVKSGEMAGQTILKNTATIERDKVFVKLTRYPYYNKYPNNYMPELVNLDIEKPMLFIKDKAKNKQILNIKNSFYIPIGGDDLLSEGPTPRLGLALVDIENYDRALKDMRRLNRTLARITPTIETKSREETKNVGAWIKEKAWKIGEAFVGTAKFKYETPSTSAHDILLKELQAALKSISAISGMPVHWLGYVDLMSNRSTADSLYESINNSTLQDRMIWASTIYDLLVNAQELYIDSGGTEISKVFYDFEVKIPLIDYNNFLERVRGWSIAFNDGVISDDDYRNELPGIDPMKTKKALDKQAKENAKKEQEDFEKMKSAFNNNNADDKQNKDEGDNKNE